MQNKNIWSGSVLSTRLLLDDSLTDCAIHSLLRLMLQSRQEPALPLQENDEYFAENKFVLGSQRSYEGANTTKSLLFTSSMLGKFERIEKTNFKFSNFWTDFYRNPSRLGKINTSPQLP